jgi:hypothetical protein
MKLHLKNSLTLDADQVLCSGPAKFFINYAFSLNGFHATPDFDSAMMRFVHALQSTVEVGKLHMGGANSEDFTVECVPEAIAALAEAYPSLSIRVGFAKWFDDANCMHVRYLPDATKYSELARVAACWWDKRMIRPGAKRGATAENLDEKLKTLVVNRAKIDAVYAEFLDALAARVDWTLRASRVCAIYSHSEWLMPMVAELDAKLGELGEGSGGTWFNTEEVMKVTHTRVLVTEKDCEYCEVFPGEHLVRDYGDSDIFQACDKYAYGKFICHADFISDK